MFSALYYWCIIYAFVSRSYGTEPRFDGEHAYQILSELSLAGHRYYEAPHRSIQKSGLVDQLEAHRLNVTIQDFEAQLPHSEKKYALHNIIAQDPRPLPNRIILATHWDTRAWAEKAHKKRDRKNPIQGANDGTSGLATILELLSTLEQRPLQHLAVDIIFFDGEELGKPGLGGYCKGSEYFAAHMTDFYPVAPTGIVVLDMVADHSLQLEQEYYSISSSPVLWSQISEHLNAQDIPLNDRSIAIKDDQYAFIQQKIPSILLIDMDYPYWHTPEDTIDKCSPESLQKIGTALLNWLWAQDMAYGVER